MFKKETIVFCFFPFKGVYYTPVDLGYIVGLMEKKGVDKYKIEIISHPLSFYDNERDIRDGIGGCVESIISKKPKAVFFFADNINWSSIYAFERASKIANELKKINSFLFVGLQSYKIHPGHIEKNYRQKIFDCLVLDDPENSFLSIDQILNKRYVEGVTYCEAGSGGKSGSFDTVGRKNITEGNFLDHIPSPYLGGFFDDYLSSEMRKNDNDFTAFLYSSRGCKFGCFYCFRSIKYEQFRFFSAKRFYDEIEYIYKKFGIGRFFVLDDAFVFSKERIERFIEEYDKRKEKTDLDNIRLFVCARPEQLDEEMLQLLRKINVVWIQVGLQTVNPGLQNYMLRSNEMKKFQEIALIAKNNNIKLLVDVILGLPYDTIDFFKKTIDFAISLGPRTIQVKQLYHCPGTRFFAEKKKYGLVPENMEKDFFLPYVKEAAGLDRSYYKEAFDYLMEKAESNKGMRWKIMTREGILISKDSNFIF